jgi:hypothetical protein
MSRTGPNRTEIGQCAGTTFLAPRGFNDNIGHVPPDALDRALHELIDEYRSRCLWFLRPDYFPSSGEEQLQVLSYIERYGDTKAFQRAADLRKWLSHPSSEASASS